MDKSSQIFKRGFSLRQAFTITNLVILTVGTTFAVIVLGTVIDTKRAIMISQLDKELAITGIGVDETFEAARDTVRSLIIGAPLAFERPRASVAEWMKAQAELNLPGNPAIYDLYFAFAEKSARRIFGSSGMAFAISRNLDYYSTPNFDAPSTFRVSTYADPAYQTSPAEIWYQGALKAPGMFRTPFYYDATYFKRVMISITQALHDPKSGEVVGVAGVDLTAGRFAQILGSTAIGSTGGVFLVDSEGRALAPFLGRDVPMIGFKNIPDFDIHADFVTTPPGSPTLNCAPGLHHLVAPNGETYVYQTKALREPGFYAVAYQKKTEAYASLYLAVALTTIFSAIVLFTSLFFRQLLARFVIENIGKILENINENRAHFTESGGAGEYRRLEPEGPREIARIAHQLNLLYQRLQLAFAEVRAEKDRAELATKAKSRFLSVMSHEIRTPLNAMLGLTDVLLLSPLNSEQVRHLRVLQRSGQSLLRILNDILDFSRLEAGKLHIDAHEFDLYELLLGVESLMRFDAENKGLEFRIVAPAHGFRLYGDSIRIRQALLNFVGNAIKFTSKGTIEIRVTPLETKSGDTSKFQFEVSDTGIGMSAEQKEKIFSEFAQADASITRRYGGTGLGLSITRHIVELLGGTLTFTSEIEKGSTFQFTLPLRILAESPLTYAESIPEPIDVPSPVSPATVENSIAVGRVLIVDDDEDNHRLIAAYMKFRRDLFAVHVYSAREALDKIRGENFVLVIMDMQMPEMDGLDATQEIRRLERDGVIPHRPIVMLSANTFAEDREKSLSAGADEHLPKPINLERFREMLMRWIPTA